VQDRHLVRAESLLALGVAPMATNVAAERRSGNEQHTA
jgi:hypothetical protein